MLRSSSATNGSPAKPRVGATMPLTRTRLTGSTLTVPISDSPGVVATT